MDGLNTIVFDLLPPMTRYEAENLTEKLAVIGRHITQWRHAAQQ